MSLTGFVLRCVRCPAPRNVAWSRVLCHGSAEWHWRLADLPAVALRRCADTGHRVSDARHRGAAWQTVL